MASNGMRIGLDSHTIAHRGLSAVELLDLAQERGLAGVQFLDPTQIDADLDVERLAAFRRRAEERKLGLEVAIPCPNPVRKSRELDREVRPAELARMMKKHVEAVAALGCRHARTFVGDRHDRFRIDTRWPDQQVATLEVLRRLAPLFRELDVRLAIETHADLTADELYRFVTALGEDVAGVTLDTGNLVMRLDDPIAATERLAPLVLAVHVKDAVLAFTHRGLCWQARPVGAGIMPIADIVGIVNRFHSHLNLTIELHPRTYDLPIYDKSWLAFFPDLRPDALASVVRLTVECERRFRDGSLPKPEQVESVPWEERDLEWIALSLGYLKPIVRLMGTL